MLTNHLTNIDSVKSWSALVSEIQEDRATHSYQQEQRYGLLPSLLKMALYSGVGVGAGNELCFCICSAYG